MRNITQMEVRRARLARNVESLNRALSWQYNGTDKVPRVYFLYSMEEAEEEASDEEEFAELIQKINITIPHTLPRAFRHNTRLVQTIEMNLFEIPAEAVKPKAEEVINEIRYALVPDVNKTEFRDAVEEKLEKLFKEKYDAECDPATGEHPHVVTAPRFIPAETYPVYTGEFNISVEERKRGDMTDFIEYVKEQCVKECLENVWYETDMNSDGNSMWSATFEER